MLLPHVEQDNLYIAARVNVAPFGGGTQPAPASPPTQIRIPLYRCPSDSAPPQNPFRLSHGSANYRAVCGPNTLSVFIADMDYGGVMYQNSKVRFEHIPDGTSNTLAAGECILDEKTDKWAALWAGMTGLVPFGGGTADRAVRVSDVMWSVDQAGARVNGPAPQAFSSRHPGGAMFVFCDGSVRFFREGGDVNLLRFLAGRNDGKVVTPDF
jgi:prepilin-type processing-associated H-X9-DG protein